MKKYCFFRNLKEKILSVILVSSMVFPALQPFLTADALESIVDTVPPVITISSPADNSTVSGFPTLSGTVTDTG